MSTFPANLGDMRVDRLLATLLLLQQRGRVTAGELAAELEVSVATARRDLEALSTAGVPVYPQAGRGGGWSLVGGARTDLSGLTAGEAQALFLLLGPTATTPALRGALRKLVRALPSTFRTDAQAAADAVVVDPSRWGERPPDLPERVGQLQSAVVRRRRVRLAYVDRRGGRTQRVVSPWGLVDKQDVWYLVAGTADGRRTFRVDRIEDVEVRDEQAERPADLDLAASWTRTVEELEDRRSTTAATVLVDPGSVWVLRSHFGRHCEELGRTEDGRARVRVAAHTARSVAEQLAGWGAAVEVTEPADVRDELARIGAELVRRYAASTPDG
jgi:predicted DNA-binding transcriptional regulator YafY